jgi:ferredoxin
MGIKVWVDQDLCTGDGLCEEICPSVFSMEDDGLSYVKENGKVIPGGGAGAMANVPEDMIESVVEAAEECPGECIFLEVEE